MALMPDPVNTRKLALAAEYVSGGDLERVSVDGFTDEYFTVVGERPDVEAEVRSIFASDELPLHLVYWSSERDRMRAQAARVGDFRESIGPDAARRVAELEATIHSR